MYHRLASSLLRLITLTLFTYNISSAQDPGLPDTVRVSSVTTTPGSKVVITVTGYNDVPLTGVLVPIEFPSSSLVADSISYVGSRLSGASLTTETVSIDSANHSLSFGAVYFGGPLSAGDGLFTKIYFTIKSDAVAETVVLDTFINPPSVLTFTDTSAMEWAPVFKPGRIIIQLENLPPLWQPIGNRSVLEGETLSISLKASDPTATPLTFAALNGPPGSKLTRLSDSTASFTWVPDFIGPYSGSGSPFLVTFVVTDGANFVRQDVNIFVINRNALPVFSLPDTINSPAQVNVSFPVSAADLDKELISIAASNLPAGATFDGNNPGSFSWTPSAGQLGVFKPVFEATDASGGKTSDTVVIIISTGQNFILSMPDAEGFSGEVVTLPVSLVNKDSVGGCQLLIHYDPSVLVLKSVTRTGTRIQSWESFSVVLDPGGNLGDIKVVGIADLPNLTSTPALDTGQGPILNLTFQISENTAFVGFTIPVTFKFTGQLDNTLSDDQGNLIDQGTITYKNGSVYIKLLDVLIGDINLNGFAFDIGDAVRFANYFVDPVKNALNAQQNANSDVNLDGITASIADLVFLIRRIVEGPAAYTGSSTASASIAKTAEIFWQKGEDGTAVGINSFDPLGGLHFVIEHPLDINVTPQFSSSLSDFQTWFKDEAGVLRVVIFSLESKSIPAGNWELFTLNSGEAKLKEVSISNGAGYLMESVQIEKVSATLPALRLDQNFPNPFNQATQISFYLAKPEKVRLDIYNIRGQKVNSILDENLAAGFHQVHWDGRNQSGENVASGIYLYRLTAGNQSQTRKLSFIK